LVSLKPELLRESGKAKLKLGVGGPWHGVADANAAVIAAPRALI
jgi:hypothetical protein